MPSPAVAQKPLSVAEYLDLDAAAQDVRYEYHDGRVVALAGASPEHNIVKENLSGVLYGTLRPRGCHTFSSDQRVKVGRRYVYPDLVALCTDPVYTDETPPSLTNPELLVEVTSESTRQDDATTKLDSYWGLESLREYWIVEPTEAQIIQYIRRGDDWIVRPVTGFDATLRCEAFDINLDLSDIYALIEMDDEQARGKGRLAGDPADEDAETHDASVN